MNYTTLIKNQGFTLIEVMISLVVVVAGMLSLNALQSNTLVNSVDSRVKTEALGLAQQEIEDIRSFSLQSEFDGSFADKVDSNKRIKGSYVNYSRTSTVSACLDSALSAGSCKKVVVVVSWPKGSIQLSSYIAQTEPANGGVLLAAMTPASPVPPKPEPEPEPTDELDPNTRPDLTPETTNEQNQTTEPATEPTEQTVRKCYLKNYLGGRLRGVPATWNDYGGVISVSGNLKHWAGNQSPQGGSYVPCTTTVTVSK